MSGMSGGERIHISNPKHFSYVWSFLLWLGSETEQVRRAVGGASNGLVRLCTIHPGTWIGEIIKVAQ